MTGSNDNTMMQLDWDPVRERLYEVPEFVMYPNHRYHCDYVDMRSMKEFRELAHMDEVFDPQGFVYVAEDDEFEMEYTLFRESNLQLNRCIQEAAEKKKKLASKRQRKRMFVRISMWNAKSKRMGYTSSFK